MAEVKITRIKQDHEEVHVKVECDFVDKEIQTLQDMLGQLDCFEDGTYGHIQMLEAFGKTNTRIEPETFCDYGRCYTDAFEQRYEKLISISDQILEAIKFNKKSDTR